MSKVGKQPINMPTGVNLNIKGRKIIVKGPKGEISIDLPRTVEVNVKDSQVKVSVRKQDAMSKALHGTFRSLIRNMIVGVSEGWSKTLELVGTGYRSELTGNKLVLSVGFSHPIEIISPEGITISVDKTKITVEGIDKQLVGETAAKIRSIRPPEPYKGKGIKYEDEMIRRKPGKAAKAQGAPV